jgi:hypothetical protein
MTRIVSWTIRATALASLIASVPACTNMQVSQNLASGSIGCPPEAIEIENEDVDNGVHTFQATCNGKAYYCTYMYPNPISCTPAAGDHQPAAKEQ